MASINCNVSANRTRNFIDSKWLWVFSISRLSHHNPKFFNILVMIPSNGIVHLKFIRAISLFNNLARNCIGKGAESVVSELGLRRTIEDRYHIVHHLGVIWIFVMVGAMMIPLFPGVNSGHFEIVTLLF